LKCRENASLQCFHRASKTPLENGLHINIERSRLVRKKRALLRATAALRFARGNASLCRTSLMRSIVYAVDFHLAFLHT